MATLKRLAVVVLTLGALTAVGCKSVQTTFVNNTNEPLELQVNGPGLGVGQLGTIPPRGQIRTLIEVCPIWLPTTYTFTAGQHKDAFSITGDSKEHIWIAIPQGTEIEEPVWRSADSKKKSGGLVPIVVE